MSTNSPRRWTWAIVIVAQLSVPVAQVAHHEWLLRDGERILLACSPVDPADPLRGRYVALAFGPAQAPAADDGRSCDGRRRIYVRLEPADQGLSRLGASSWDSPSAGTYLRARCVRELADGRVAVDLPFDRYYLEEGLAPEAELAYRDRTRGPLGDAWVAIRVRNGRAVLEELYFDGKPLREALAAPPLSPR